MLEQSIMTYQSLSSH
uniref:Uncharacterized protein n=1 Tax=Arundo donax TaxID=35708 RepID=A0A0A9H1W9_ARUDO